ncbi:hypothetical protein DMH01_07050 [Amycolatopsis sp. WAC 04182]|uniref:hypothetical protein n=1 Tax=Amycolatopsis sp. WAC 04182 TaxID=2203198 RepID=UPI000F7B65F7|nr:hypothetical protein [Amycolatopsis sp. WAC 04182]RSN66079.1 hypothetical protein DMH01_07050 [Amycolatopsis sp. WAC 04182]
MSDDLGAMLRRAYEDGATIADLKSRHGLTYHRARVLLLAAGTTLRKNGPSSVVPASPSMVIVYEHGMTIHEVAENFGYTYSTMRRKLLAAGITPRKKGRRLA